MSKMNKPAKRFLRIVEEIRDIIENEKIKVGEKIPSERTLAEQLEVGRPTIREALRSMEMLGLIETRHGEGTFLTDFKKHQLVEVLSTFVMSNERAVQDVLETRKIHEREAIRTICREAQIAQLPVWESLYTQLSFDGVINREDLLREMMISTGNRLVLKIWFLLKQYSPVQIEKVSTPAESQPMKDLLKYLALQEEIKAIEAYETWQQIMEKKEG